MSTDAGRTCELCGQAVEVVTADEGTQSYRGVAAQRAIDELLTVERVAGLLAPHLHEFIEHFEEGGCTHIEGLENDCASRADIIADALIEELRR